MVNYSDVSARAMLVSLHISVWDAQRYNREVSDEVAEQKQAEKHSGRYNVHLFGSRKRSKEIAPEFAAVHDAASQLYDFHIQNTLPWGTTGERLLATKAYYQYTDGVRLRGMRLERAAAEFADAYPRLVEEAKARLAGLYREDDFPPASEVRRRFGWSVDVGPVPSAGDLRVDLPADQLAAIEQQVTARAEERTREAMGDAWARLHQVVERIRRASGETATGRKSPVFDTLIESARETCELLARLNVGEDERLEEMRQRVEQELTDIAVEDLRTDAKVRQDTTRRATDIASAMSAFYAPQKEVA